jgi:hypothetical protein
MVNDAVSIIIYMAVLRLTNENGSLIEIKAGTIFDLFSLFF